MAEIKSPEELDAFLKSEHERERANYKENVRLMDYHIDRISGAYPTATLEELESLKEQCKKIITAYKKENETSPSPYQFYLDGNKLLTDCHNYAISIFNNLAMAIDLQIKTLL